MNHHDPAVKSTELDRAIERAKECQDLTSHIDGQWIYMEHDKFDVLVTAAKRLKEVEKERDDLQAKVLQLEPETVALTYDVERMREHLANVNRENMDNRNAFENEYKNHQDTTRHNQQLREELSKANTITQRSGCLLSELQSLQAALKECAATLKAHDAVQRSITIPQWETLKIKALSNPLVQTALNPPPP